MKQLRPTGSWINRIFGPHGLWIRFLTNVVRAPYSKHKLIRNIIPKFRHDSKNLPRPIWYYQCNPEDTAKALDELAQKLYNDRNR